MKKSEKTRLKMLFFYQDAFEISSISFQNGQGIQSVHLNHNCATTHNFFGKHVVIKLDAEKWMVSVRIYARIQFIYVPN